MTTTIPKRRRSDRRVNHPPNMRLTERDKAIIYTIHTHRVLRQDQLETLFDRSRSVMQRVLVRLYDHGFLERKFLSTRGWNSPTLYVLDRKGAELLRREYNLDDLVWYSSSKELKQEFLEHTLAINDIRIAFTKAAEVAGYELLKWVNETELKAAMIVSPFVRHRVEHNSCLSFLIVTLFSKHPMGTHTSFWNWIEAQKRCGFSRQRC